MPPALPEAAEENFKGLSFYKSIAYYAQKLYNSISISVKNSKEYLEWISN